MKTENDPWKNTQATATDNTGNAKYVCSNPDCERIFDDNGESVPYDEDVYANNEFDVWDRVYPGDIMPYGECSECEYLVYPITSTDVVPTPPLPTVVIFMDDSDGSVDCIEGVTAQQVITCIWDEDGDTELGGGARCFLGTTEHQSELSSIGEEVVTARY